MRRHAKASVAGSTQGSGMRRGLFGLACLCVLGLVAFLGSGAPSAGAAGACPNEALREQEGATFLPDCRGYEQVSPIDKNGSNIEVFQFEGEGANLAFKPTGPVLTTANGEAVLFSSHGAFAEAQSAGPTNLYVASRGTDWLTRATAPPTWDGNPIFSAFVTPGTSADLSTQLVGTEAAVTPGSVDGNANLYIRNASASYELVSSVLPGSPAASGYSVDGTSWIFTKGGDHLESTPPPVNGSSSSNYNVYEYTNGELKLAGILPDGTASPDGSSAAGPSGSLQPGPIARRAISDDATQVYWKPSLSGERPLYLYREGHSTLVTERESDHSAQAGQFWFATPDGRFALLTSEDRLTGDASPAGVDLYRYDREAEALVDLTPTAGSAEVEGVLGIGDDGSHVYFEAPTVLASGAIAGQHNIYVWHDGEIRLIATSESGFSEELSTEEGLRLTRVSPSGDYLGFAIDGELTGPHPQPDRGADEVYLYRYDTNTLACPSCLPGGAAASGSASFERLGEGDPVQLGNYRNGLSRNLFDDGRLYFETPDALVARDGNGLTDVYEYDAGAVQLISSGESGLPSFFGNASASGSDVFIGTAGRLVGQDKDEYYDLYDARVNGGIAAQNPVSESSGCEGETCQGSPTAAASSSAAASAGVVGKGNLSQKQNCNKLGREAKKLSNRAKRLRKNGKQAKRNGKSAIAKKHSKKATRLAKQARNKSKSAKKCRKRNRGASK